jgi:hypothetical protein
VKRRQDVVNPGLDWTLGVGRGSASGREELQEILENRRSGLLRRLETGNDPVPAAFCRTVIRDTKGASKGLGLAWRCLERLRKSVQVARGVE